MSIPAKAGDAFLMIQPLKISFSNSIIYRCANTKLNNHSKTKFGKIILKRKIL